MDSSSVCIGAPEAHEHVHDQLLSAPEGHRDGLTPSRYHLEVSRSSQTRCRRLQALVLVAVAIGLVVVEPFPKGVVLLRLTHTHGVDVGDLPALALLLLAACLAI
jgi:hypothetical protein